jgi:hypothetical protein
MQNGLACDALLRTANLQQRAISTAASAKNAIFVGFSGS